MALNKVNYIDNQTRITAQNLNNIQDNIIQNAELIKKVAPRNLLDNSDFTNPVNQRGQTIYTGFEYTIDRWLLSGNAGEQNTMWISEDGYIGLSGGNTVENVWLVQRVPSNVIPTGNKATFAVKQNGVETPYILNIDMWGTDKVVNFPSGVSLLYQSGELIIYNGTGNAAGFVWAALYEGEYTAETLPEYRPKGYAHELLECQRYCVKLSQIIPMFCYSADDRQVRGTMIAPTRLRVKPSVERHTVSWIFMGGYDTSTNGNTTLIVNDATDGIDITVTLPPNITPTLGDVYMVAIDILLSADL